MLENTDGIGAPHQCSLGAAACYLLFMLTAALLLLIGTIQVCPVLVETDHRRDIVKVLSIPSPPRFMTVSEDGVVTFWTNKVKQIEMLKLDELSFKQTRSLRSVANPNPLHLPPSGSTCAGGP